MSEIDKMQTPWDSDKILMVDVGCAERGCMGVASDWAAGGSPECRPMQEYKEWVGLTDEEMYKVWLSVDEENDRMAFGKAVQAKLKELNT
jgi:hypothetical protein